MIGDFFVDKYLIIERALAETSLETGLAAHQVVEVRCQPGAAGTITSNLRAMDIQVLALGAVGDDGEGVELLRGLRGTGVDITPLIIHAGRFTPTYIKPMLREPDGLTHELSRFDIKNRAPLPAEAEDRLIAALRSLAPRVHGVIVADQAPEEDCGAITGRVREELRLQAISHPNVPFVVDSRERIGLFRNMMLKPNAHEAVRALDTEKMSDPARDLVKAAGAALHRRAGQPVFLTLGAEGILVFQGNDPTHIPAVPVRGPIDIVGAGDATIAGITASLCSGATAPEAAHIGCLAAAVTIRQIGTTGTASRGQIREIFSQNAAGA